MNKEQVQKNKYPLVSVIIPVLNAAPYLNKALDSVIFQSYRNIEIICIDDGSIDDSLAILNAYQNKYPEIIKVYKNKKNLGVALTSNFGISKAKGEYISRFDADDIMLPDRVYKQVMYLNSHPNVVVVGGQVELISDDSHKIGNKMFPTGAKEIYKTMFKYMPIQQGASMFNTKKLPHGFVWYKNESRTAEEVELFFRLFQYGDFANLPDVVIKYRQYSTSTSLVDPKKTFFVTISSRLTAIFKYGYKPTIEGLVTNLIQLVIVTLLPARAIYPLFTFLRGIKPIISLESVRKIYGKIPAISFRQ